MQKNLNCPSCFAPLDISNRFVKLVRCDFCTHVSVVTDSGLDPTGKTAKLTQLMSMLYLDATGTIDGKAFQVIGRLRYQYSAGYWDEWFVTFDNESPGWLVEDEGLFKLYKKQTLTSAIPPFETIKVGSTIKINGRDLFVTEKGNATIAGGEGQLAFMIMPGEALGYIDGSADGAVMSLEYYEDEIELSVGRPIPRESIIVDEDDF